MPVFQWRDAYSVNVRQIDNEHKQLFDLANEMYDAMYATKGADVLGPILNRLVDYAGTHLSNEERLMQTYGYPDFAAHKRAHDELRKKVGEYVEKTKSGEGETFIEVARFLGDWLRSHIQQVDRRYTEHLNARGLT
ncbi:MAG: bacteriohemerythrin [Desulfatibacillaceae bacterium]